jgi:malate synthase
MSDPTRRPDRIESHGLQIARVVYEFVNDEALPGSGVSQERFWAGLANLIRELSPRNAQLLQRRDQLQQQIDAWHQAHPGPDFDARMYRRMLENIGYLQPEGDPFVIDVQQVDAEIAHIARPQLVVPVDNARYAIHARRCGSPASTWPTGCDTGCAARSRSTTRCGAWRLSWTGRMPLIRPMSQ